MPGVVDRRRLRGQFWFGHPLAGPLQSLRLRLLVPTRVQSLPVRGARGPRCFGFPGERDALLGASRGDPAVLKAKDVMSECLVYWEMKKNVASFTEEKRD